MTAVAVDATGVLKIAMKRLVRAHPFHAHVLALARIEADASIETMAVTVRDGQVVFLYDPAFVVGLGLEQLVGVLKHEILHVVFGHIFADPALYPDRRARIIAEEVTVNEWVSEPLPGKPVLLRDYPQLPEMEDTDTRYGRLASSHVGAPTPDTVDDHDVWDEARAERLVGEAVVLSTVRRAVESLTADETDRIPAALFDAIAAAARGKAAGRDIETLSRSARPSAVPWRAVLRRFVGRTLVVDPTYLRPPRRFPHLVGIVPGGSRRPDKPRVMAVIDTSGSMTRELLEQIGLELQRMSAHCEVVVVECDAEIHGTYPFQGRLSQVCGRGGTDLRPPFERAVLMKVRPDVIVYFTDGEGPAPDRAPRVPVLWCLTPGGSQPASWGRCVRMT